MIALAPVLLSYTLFVLTPGNASLLTCASFFACFGLCKYRRLINHAAVPKGRRNRIYQIRCRVDAQPVERNGSDFIVGDSGKVDLDSIGGSKRFI